VHVIGTDGLIVTPVDNAHPLLPHTPLGRLSERTLQRDLRGSWQLEVVEIVDPITLARQPSQSRTFIPAQRIDLGPGDTATMIAADRPQGVPPAPARWTRTGRELHLRGLAIDESYLIEDLDRDVLTVLGLEPSHSGLHRLTWTRTGPTGAALVTERTTEPAREWWRSLEQGNHVDLQLQPDWLWTSSREGVQIREPTSGDTVADRPTQNRGRGYFTQTAWVFTGEGQRQLEAVDPITDATLWTATLTDKEWVEGGGGGVLVIREFLPKEGRKRLARMRGVDARTGEERWSFNHDGPLRGVFGQRVFAHETRIGLALRRLADGKLLALDKGFELEPELLADGGVDAVWIRGEGTVASQVLARYSGAPLKPTGSCTLDHHIQRVVACGDQVYAFDGRSTIAAYDATSCAPQGRWSVGRPGSLQAGEVDGRCTLVARQVDGHLVALDVEDGMPTQHLLVVEGQVTWPELPDGAEITEAAAWILEEKVPVDEEGRFRIEVEGAGIATVEVRAATNHNVSWCENKKVEVVDFTAGVVELEVEGMCWTHMP